MKSEKVISAVETTIAKICIDIRKKAGSVGSDKINSLSKLVNSYNRFVERAKDNSNSANNNYYDLMFDNDN